MVSLEWRRKSDMAWLPPGAPLQFGKTVVLRGAGYVKVFPSEFILYRVPTKLVSWALTSQGKAARWELARRPVRASWPALFSTRESESVALSPGGFFGTHRWQFADSLGNWSPVVRTTRFTTLKSSLNGSYSGVGASIETTVQTTVDPKMTIDLSLPWDANERYPTPQETIIREVEDLRQIEAGIGSPNGVLQPLAQFFPTQRPSGLQIDWQPRELDLDGGEMRAFPLHISSASGQPFAFCFVATNLATGDVATSEVAVTWRDETGAVTAFGLEG